MRKNIKVVKLSLSISLIFLCSCVSMLSSSSSKLAKDKVQTSVEKALEWTKKGGSVTVLGIQELPQENAARADITFDKFQYNADKLGQPISKDKKPQPPLNPNDPDFYKKMAQMAALDANPHVETYSGTGIAIIKHYNDGRWVLAEVHFGMNGIKAESEIR